MEKAGGFSLTITLPTSLRSLSLKAGTGQTKSLPFRRNLNLHTSMGNEQMCPRVLRALEDVTARTLSMIYEKLWQSKPSVTGEKRTPRAFLKRVTRGICDLEMLDLENLRKYFPFKIISAS